MSKFNVNVFILESLSKGVTQINIVKNLKDGNYTPSSSSSVDKKVKRLLNLNNCKTTFQLMYKYGKNKESIIY